jgi:hypothetical protein
MSFVFSYVKVNYKHSCLSCYCNEKWIKESEKWHVLVLRMYTGVASTPKPTTRVEALEQLKGNRTVWNYLP